MAYQPRIFAPKTPEGYVATELDLAVMPLFTEQAHISLEQESNRVAQTGIHNKILAYQNLTNAVQHATDPEVSAAITFRPIKDYVERQSAISEDIYQKNHDLYSRFVYIEGQLTNMLVGKNVVVTPLVEADFIIRTFKNRFSKLNSDKLISSTEPFLGTVEYVEDLEVKVKREKFPYKTTWTRFFPIMAGLDPEGPAWVQRYSFDWA